MCGMVRSPPSIRTATPRTPGKRRVLHVYSIYIRPGCTSVQEAAHRSRPALLSGCNQRTRVENLLRTQSRQHHSEQASKTQGSRQTQVSILQLWSSNQDRVDERMGYQILLPGPKKQKAFPMTIYSTVQSHPSNMWS